MRHHHQRIGIIAACAIALTLSACGDAAEQKAASEKSPEVKAPAGERLTLTPTDSIRWQDVSAQIATTDQAQILARIPGILTTLTVREGDIVQKGQVIGRIVDSQLGYQSGAYGAQAAAAQAQAAQAQSDLARVRYLYQNGVYAKARLDQAEAAAAAAQAQVRAAQAQQSAVGAVAGQGAVVAPSTGRVLSANVPAGSPVSPGMAIAVITSGPTVLRLELPESLAGAVHTGSRVMTSGFDGRDMVGQVIKLYPSISAGQVTADVALPGIDNQFIGRRLAAKVETGTRPALRVPRHFVTQRYGMDYVTLLGKNGQAIDVPVQTTGGDAEQVEILSGVRAGDTLIAPAGAKAAATKVQP